jgi:hypothetical protein
MFYNSNLFVNYKITPLKSIMNKTVRAQGIMSQAPPVHILNVIKVVLK